MENPRDPIQQAFELAKTIVLDPKVKARQRAYLLSFTKAQERFFLEMIRRRWQQLFSVLVHRARGRYFAALFAFSLAVGGISYGAEGSLPGNTLYPFKLNFNENIRSWFAFGPEAKATWELQRADRRLQELEQIAQKKDVLQGHMIPELAKHFQDHTKRALALVDDQTALHMKMYVLRESFLEAHNDILSSLRTKANEDPQIAKELDLVLQDVKNQLEEEEKGIGPLEDRIFEGVAERDIEKAAKMSIAKAQGVFVRTEKTLTSHPEIGEQMRLAREAIAQSNAVLQKGEARKAFDLSLDALVSVGSASHVVELSKKTGIDIQ